LWPWKVYNTKLNHIPLIQCIFCFLNINPTISQSFKYIGLIHGNIEVHIHEFCKCDKNYCQISKSNWLLNVHDFDVFCCILESEILLTLHKWVPFLIFLIILLFYFILFYLRNTRKLPMWHPYKIAILCFHMSTK